MNVRRLGGVALAAAAVGLFAMTAAAPTAAQEAKVKCEGVNACKGKGGCKSAKNDCKGKNACKGKSFVETKSPQECNQRGGQVVKK